VVASVLEDHARWRLRSSLTARGAAAST